ncbi:alanine--tRNA ligase, mitochondrial isoform X2 [Anoplophora glabripennis]|nr:alanine--tRNA ligase, mitochondrial isoform X2 [Anoplophora glabripennis]
MGDEVLGITEDLETKEIWKEIGVPEERILPFGANDNFWEMGLTGPCGPCTEIHIDHIGVTNRSEFVNKGLHDLTELWNIVFIEYNRHIDGTISTLPQKHVDTGMGFERLTSVLQGKTSNYDTDNFAYLLDAIHKNSRGLPKYGGKFGEMDWDNLDTSYRILADHLRMITVCLADGVIPEQNQKLRRILRKAFLLSESVFKKEKGLVKELTNYVVENLGPIYPEMERNVTQIQQIVNYEEEIYKYLRQSVAKDWERLSKENKKFLEIDIVESPSFITAYKEVASLDVKELDANLAFKLYDTYGLDEDTIFKLSRVLDLKFNSDLLDQELEKAKYKSKENSLTQDDNLYSTLVKENIPKTHDRFKYLYSKDQDKYVFNSLDVKVLKIFQEGTSVPEIDSDFYCSLLLDRTNLYSEAGGQICDTGTISFGNNTFDVMALENINGYILHKGFFKSKGSRLDLYTRGQLSVNPEFRLGCMRNHTGAHLLNAAVKKVKGATCQKSSKVTDKYLSFDIAIFGDKLDVDQIHTIEEQILKTVKNEQPVNVSEVDSQKLLDFDFVTLIPGEIYPDSGIRIVEIKDTDFVSREPCCGTHVLNTSDIGDFCIVNVKSLGRSTTSISAVTGDRAKLARSNAAELVEEIDALTKNIGDNIDKPELLDMIVSNLRRKLNYSIQDEFILPICVKHYCIEKLDQISKQIRETTRENLRDFIEIEMQNVLDSSVKTSKSNKKYIVHYLRSSMILQSVPLQKATKLCPDLPILVISYADNMVKARCCVPKKLRTDKFNAEKWMKETVATVFNSRAAPPKGQDGSLVCNMKSKRVHLQDWDPLLNEGLEKAQQYVEENL